MSAVPFRITRKIACSGMGKRLYHCLRSFPARVSQLKYGRWSWKKRPDYELTVPVDGKNEVGAKTGTVSTVQLDGTMGKEGSYLSVHALRGGCWCDRLHDSGDHRFAE